MKNRLLIVIVVFLALLAQVSFAAGKVLVVINKDSSDSKEIGNYYVSKRHIPAQYVCKLECKTDEVVRGETYDKIKAAIKSHLTKNKIKDKVDYIVLTKGIPIRSVRDGKTFSVDSMLTLLWSDAANDRTDNPYFNAKEHFSYKKMGMYLVTRLDGYTVEDAKKLVDNSLAAKKQNGIFMFDLDPNKDKRDGLSWLNDAQRVAMKVLQTKNLRCDFGIADFPQSDSRLMGYYNWGSNRSKYTLEKYTSNKFYPGAIVETVVSTSARTFKHTTEGQSLIADLIHCGVTGIKGYVWEPYSVSMAQPQVLFDRYTAGFNLAESFYAASPFVHWMDIVIGDPLCAPYADSKGRK